MLKGKIFIVGLFLLGTLVTNAQVLKEFSQDPVVFPNDLKTYFTPYPASNDVITKFISEWGVVSFYSEDEKADIMKNADLLLKQKVRAPDMTTYFKLLSLYKAKNVDPEKLKNFNDVVGLILNKHKTDYNDFANACVTLATDLTLFGLQGKKWVVNTDKYEFVFDSVPRIIFNSLDLELFTNGDTLSIYGTQGAYMPVTNKWKGEGGTIYWTRVGFTRDQVRGEIKKYALDVRGSDFIADSALLYYPRIFDKPILGILSDKASMAHQGEKSSYPRFLSYKSTYFLKNVFQDVDYLGGFSIEGQNIEGKSSDSSRATIFIKYYNKVQMKVISRSFIITPEKVAALRASISLYEGKDSLYHSQVIFNFNNTKRLVTLSRQETGLYASPYFDSYHQLEFSVDNVLWYIDSPNVEMKSVSNGEKSVPFESSQFYDANKYVMVQGILAYNPLVKIADYLKSDTNRSVSVNDLAGYFQNKPEYIQNLLINLARDGFIFYDIPGQRVFIKEKLVHYVASYKKKQDFDAIKWESIIARRPNVKLNILNNEMEIQGVPRINLSDSQQTYIVPRDQTVKITKNRDMVFDGHVHSGRFDFYGNGYKFEYDKFQINLTNLDSVKFKFPEYDSNGKYVRLRTIQNSLQNVTGVLFIDKPDNKSGTKMLEEYPIFQCTKESFVYYEKPTIFNNVYKKDRFYFKVDPFIIEKLDNFTAEGLQFPGTFVSAKIFPTLSHSLYIMDDFSLGFIKPTPEAGLSLYQGKGLYKGNVNLSNKGLRGEGEVDYLISKMKSRDFLFFPDSMNAISDSFDVPDLVGSIFPPVKGIGVYNHWMPYADSLFIKKRSDLLTVYKGKVDFTGGLVMTPKELVGDGNVKYHDVELASHAVSFFKTNITAKSGDLKLKSEQSSKSAVEAADVNAAIDLNKDFAEFKTNDITEKVTMPSQKFSTSLNNFTYDLNKREVNFTKAKDLDADSAYFVSDNPDMLGLKINSQKATFDLNNLDLTAKDVPNILVADSRIYTPHNEILIQKEGVIGGIKDAVIITNDEDKFHKIYGGNVNILSNQSFKGDGYYDYYDKNNKKFTLHFNDIHTTADGHTEAWGQVADSSKFYPTPKLQFQGKILLYSMREELGFDGLVFPETKYAKNLGTQWVKVADTTSPAEIRFMIKNPVGKDNKQLYTGTFLSEDSTGVMYNLFFGKKHNASDHPVFSTKGILFYDDKTMEFTLGDSERVTLPNDEGAVAGGNFFRLNELKSEVFTEGVYDFGVKYKHVELATAGNYTFNLKDSANNFSLVMWADFPFSDDPIKLMVDTTLGNSYNLDDTKNDREEIVNGFAVLIKDKKDKEKIVTELATLGYIQSNEILNKTLMFTDLNLSYVDTMKGFISIGPIGLGTVKKSNVYKKMDGIVMMIRSKEGDDLYILLESSAGSYYYYNYSKGVLAFLSSDYVFDDKVVELASKLEKAQDNFHLKLATVNDVEVLKRFKR